MKKVIISVISTLLVLAFMVQMGWLQVIGINRFSFEKSDNTQDKLDFECASENNIKSKNKFDYVERVRENSDNVMQSVDLKMMGKFLDEQKKKQSIKEKTKKENKINKAADVSEIIKDSNETEV